MRAVAVRAALVVVALALGAGAAGGCGGDDPTLAGLVRDPAPRVDGVGLPDASRGGEELAFRAGPGGVLLVYFGYTRCPDVCPTTMSDIRLALDDLTADERDAVGVAVVTVDPDRDTAGLLRRYVRSFVPDGHALRTEDARRLSDVARAFGAGYDVKRTPAGEVEVAHTAFVYAVDETGHLLVQWPFGTTWEVLRDDLRTLLSTTGGAG